MNELFKQIFAKYNLSDEQLDKFVSDFTTALVVSLIVGMNNLTKEDEVKLEHMLREHEGAESITALLESKFDSKEAWAKYVEAQAVPLLENYIQTVIKA